MRDAFALEAPASELYRSGMRAIQLDGGFGVAKLSVTERPRSVVGPGQIELRMLAASLNYRDLLMVRGEYDPKLGLPLIPGSDGVGEIVTMGEGVSEFRLGERVCPLVANGWYEGSPTRTTLRQTRGGPLDGVLQEYVVLNAGDVVRPPAFLSNEQAATLPCAALTAFSALFRHSKLVSSECVLVLGTGGVSMFALQFAKAAGARVIVTSRSDEKLAKARSLGADFTLNTGINPEFGQKVRELSGGEGVDYVIEVGGADTLAESLRAVRPGGSVHLIGVLAGKQGPLNLLPLLMRDVRLQGVFIGPRRSFVEMNQLIQERKIVPAIDRSFPLDEAREAFSYLASGAHVGKVCLRF
ncbi:MAG: NAD(P)-dependent alcohol dehydrogenase [Polyangiaceae bacterium]|nr:NAD(P)-dependent alcohol dehydrogenase [Polyangiaceae bacterium]